MARTRSELDKEECVLFFFFFFFLSPGGLDKFLRIKKKLKSLWQMRLPRQIKDAGGNEVLVCSWRVLLFCIDGGTVNRGVAEEQD